MSQKSECKCDFNKSKSRAEVEAAIDSIPYPNAQTYDGKALEIAADELFSDARDAVPRILVVISGSWIGNDESETSGELHRAGVKIVSIGLGKHFNLAQLYVMASQTKDDHVFTVDFPQIPNIVWAIQDTLYIG